MQNKVGRMVWETKQLGTTFPLYHELCDCLVLRNKYPIKAIISILENQLLFGFPRLDCSDKEVLNTKQLLGPE